ncbi:MAG: hypothetical protein FJX52_13040 [Alphaproteobacteria bacterium]|nr:hypothetical protein [Alphaproteobacteria bacterium]
MENGDFAVREIEPWANPAAGSTVAAPTLTNLMAELEVEAFGPGAAVEKTPSGFALTCSAQAGIGGALLSSHALRWPALPGLKLGVAHDGPIALVFGVSDTARQRQGNPMLLGMAPPGMAAAPLSLPDQGIDRSSPLRITLVCPAAGGRFALTGVRLEPAAASVAPAAVGARNRAYWSWVPHGGRSGQRRSWRGWPPVAPRSSM